MSGNTSASTSEMNFNKKITEILADQVGKIRKSDLAVSADHVGGFRKSEVPKRTKQKLLLGAEKSHFVQNLTEII